MKAKTNKKTDFKTLSVLIKTKNKVKELSKKTGIRNYVIVDEAIALYAERLSTQQS